MQEPCDTVSDWPWAIHLRCLRSANCRFRSINRVPSGGNQMRVSNGCPRSTMFQVKEKLSV